VLTVDDIDDPARMREALRSSAVIDPITGCYDQASVLAVLDQALGSNRGTAAIMIQLRGLDEARADFGHTIADDLLKSTAQAVAAPLRGGDVVGRYGTGQFLAVCHGVDEPVQALAIAGRIRESLRTGLKRVDPTAPVPHVDLGVTLVRPGTERDSVVAQALIATRRSGRLGTGMPVLFHDEARG
jgi:diguanylate cyclase (GGDEF)-like protein